MLIESPRDICKTDTQRLDLQQCPSLDSWVLSAAFCSSMWSFFPSFVTLEHLRVCIMWPSICASHAASSQSHVLLEKFVVRDYCQSSGEDLTRSIGGWSGPIDRFKLITMIFIEEPNKTEEWLCQILSRVRKEAPSLLFLWAKETFKAFGICKTQ